jgi:hypothetical protein
MSNPAYLYTPCVFCDMALTCFGIGPSWLQQHGLIYGKDSVNIAIHVPNAAAP